MKRYMASAVCAEPWSIMRLGLGSISQALWMVRAPAPLAQQHVLLRLETAADPAGLSSCGDHCSLESLSKGRRDNGLSTLRLLLLLVDGV